MNANGLLLVCRHRIPDAIPSLVLTSDAEGSGLSLALCYRNDPPERRFMLIGIDEADWDRAADDVVDEIVAHETERRAG